jgi:sortase A
MRLARVLGAVGRVFITSGVLILLFVAYQLWGTGIREAQAQNRLEKEFRQLQEEARAATVGSTTPPNGTVPTETLPASPAEPLAAPPEGEVLGQIEIPDIGLSAYMIEGVKDEDLHDGPGHYPGTPLPGQAGNSAIAGHRTTYGAPFNELDKLEDRDEVVVEMPYGRFVYQVEREQIVDPTATWVTRRVGHDRVVLTACHPKYSAAQRIVIFARLARTEQLAWTSVRT